jgi:hypothetical protein
MGVTTPCPVSAKVGVTDNINYILAYYNLTNGVNRIVINYGTTNLTAGIANP